MRSILIMGIIVVLTLLLEGCGHKGPLILPAPQAQTSPAQITNPQLPDLQKPGLLSSQQNK
jgi:predicted small lipoprotein YifL